MADNVPITAGAGTSIATDDVGSVHFQKIKLDAGGDGVSVPVVAGQQAKAASVPVVLASDQGALASSVADGANVALGAAADAAVTTDAAGTISGKLRGLVAHLATLLSRLPAALGANGGLKVEGVAGGVAVPVSAAALPLPSGAATSALQGGGLPAALGAGGGLKVDGSGTALPVSGTVAVTNADMSTVAGAVSGGHMQADVVGALPAGTAVIGTTMDGGPSWTPAYLHTLSADATGIVDVTAAPTSGQKIVIDDIIVSVGTDMTVTFEEETAHTDIIVLYMAANTSAQITPRGKIKLPTADKKLQIDTSVAGNVAVTVCYHSEA